jgi:phage terminase large subunit
MNSWGDLIVDEKGRKTKYFPCHAGQYEVLQSNARFTAAIAGTGGGKTVAGALWLMREIEKKPLARYLVVTPTFKVLRSATLPAWKQTVESTALEGEHKVADSEYIMPCGAKIFFRSAEDPRSMQGIVASAAWVDEGGLISKEAWDTVLQRVGYQRGRVLVTTTPYAHNFLFKEFYQRWKSGDKTYCCVQFPSVMNPTYPVEEFQRARETLPAHRFAMLYCGQFMRAEGLVYDNLESCLTEKPATPPTGRLVGGIDFGFNDPFAAVAGVLDNDGVLWLIYERYVRGKTLEEHYPSLPKEVSWFADSSRPDSIKDLRRMGLYVKPCKKGSGSIERGITLVHSRINSGTLKIIRGATPALLAEAEQYRYPSHDDQSYSDTPVDESNHALDALRYLITGLDRKRILTAGY